MSAIKGGKLVPMAAVFDDPQFNEDHLQGMLWLCKWLATSPRMHKPQMELLVEQHAEIGAAIVRRFPKKEDAR